MCLGQVPKDIKLTRQGQVFPAQTDDAPHGGMAFQHGRESLPRDHREGPAVRTPPIFQYAGHQGHIAQSAQTHHDRLSQDSARRLATRKKGIHALHLPATSSKEKKRTPPPSYPSFPARAFTCSLWQDTLKSLAGRRGSEAAVTRSTRNRVTGDELVRGFESHPLRHLC